MPTALALTAVALALLSSPLAAQELVDVAMAGTEMMEDDLPSIASAPDGSAWVVFLAYSDRRDEVAIRQWTDGQWGNLRFVPNTSGDVWLPQAGVDAEGRLWVVWSQMLDGNWDMYRALAEPGDQPGGERRFGLRTTRCRTSTPALHPMAVATWRWPGKDSAMAESNIYLKTYSASGGWSDDIRVTGRPVNEWEPAVAFDSAGTVWVAYDSYANGNYDVFLTGVRDGRITEPETAVAATPRYEAKATVAVDSSDRVWVAWEAGGANWGKDTGYNIRPRQPGVVIGAHREVRIAALANGRLMSPVRPLQETFADGAGTPKWTYQPHVFTDAGGNVLVAAKRLLRHTDNRTGTRGRWEYWLTRYEGDSWTPAEAIPQSFGRSSTRISFARSSDGSSWLAWPTDNRTTAYGHRPIRGEAWVGRIEPAGPAARPALREPEPEEVEIKAWHPDESADLAAMRGYRTSVHGRPVQIVRGDFHRHTELSWDGGGGNDGNLQEFYRYMIDAAAMDFGASTDHQGGPTPIGGGIRRR